MWIRRVRLALAIAALVCLGVIGLNNVTAWRGAQNGAQRLAVIVAVGAGIVSLAAIAALRRRVAWLRSLLIIIVLATAASGGLAAWAWGNAPARGWVIATAVGAILGAVAAALAWPSRAAERSV
jgi:hypothetical protein